MDLRWLLHVFLAQNNISCTYCVYLWCIRDNMLWIKNIITNYYIIISCSTNLLWVSAVILGFKRSCIDTEVTRSWGLIMYPNILYCVLIEQIILCTVGLSNSTIWIGDITLNLSKIIIRLCQCIYLKKHSMLFWDKPYVLIKIN